MWWRKVIVGSVDIDNRLRMFVSMIASSEFHDRIDLFGLRVRPLK